MKNKKEPFDFYKDLEDKSELIFKDKQGTEYYIPKDLSKVDFELVTERYRAWIKWLLAHHWRQFRFELLMLFYAIWWYLEMKVKG